MIFVAMTHHNHPRYTDIALQSLKQNAACFYEAVVFDDGSDEPYVSELAATSRRPEPAGVIATWNAAVRWWMTRTSHEYMLLTNNDVIFFPDFDQNMARVFERRENCGIVGPITNVTGAGHQIRQGLLSDKLSEFSAEVKSKLIAVIEPEVIDYVNGFCFMLRRDRLATREGSDLFWSSHIHWAGEDNYQAFMKQVSELRPYVAMDAFVYHFKDVSMGSAAYGRMGLDPKKLPARIEEGPGGDEISGPREAAQAERC